MNMGKPMVTNSFFLSFSFFLSLSLDHFLPTHCRSRGLLSNLITLTDTHTHTLCRTPLDEGSTRHTDLDMTTINIHNRQSFKLLGRIRTRIPSKWVQQMYALDRAATGIGQLQYREINLISTFWELFSKQVQTNAVMIHLAFSFLRRPP
jgi:hypothetical protein